MLSLIGAICASILAVYISKWFWDRLKAFRLRAELGLEGPPAHFLLGNLSDIIRYNKKHGRENTIHLYREMREKYGNTFGTIDLEIAQEVFISQFSNFVDRDTYSFSDTFPLGESLLQIKGQADYDYGWKTVRSVISPTFTTGKMKLMHESMHQKVQNFLQVVEKHADSGKAFDFYDEAQALTLDVIGQCAFGLQTDSLNDRRDSFYVNCQRFFLAYDFNKSWAIRLSVIFPSIGAWMHDISEVARVERPLISNLRELLKKRKQTFTDRGHTDLVQLLLEQDEIRQKNEKKPPFKDSTIISNCFAFLLAGYETTSTAMTFTAWLLAKHQPVQEKLLEEIANIYGDKPIEYEKTMRMPYLDAVFHESLRIFPPVVFFSARTCVQETTIKGIRFPGNLRNSLELCHPLKSHKKDYEIDCILLHRSLGICHIEIKGIKSPANYDEQIEKVIEQLTVDPVRKLFEAFCCEHGLSQEQHNELWRHISGTRIACIYDRHPGSDDRIARARGRLWKRSTTQRNIVLTSDTAMSGLLEELLERHRERYIFKSSLCRQFCALLIGCRPNYFISPTQCANYVHKNLYAHEIAKICYKCKRPKPQYDHERFSDYLKSLSADDVIGSNVSFRANDLYDEIYLTGQQKNTIDTCVRAAVRQLGIMQVIVGAPGTGKSLILLLIAYIFMQMPGLKQKPLIFISVRRHLESVKAVLRPALNLISNSTHDLNRLDNVPGAVLTTVCTDEMERHRTLIQNSNVIADEQCVKSVYKYFRHRPRHLITVIATRSCDRSFVENAFDNASRVAWIERRNSETNNLQKPLNSNSKQISSISQWSVFDSGKKETESDGSSPCSPSSTSSGSSFELFEVESKRQGFLSRFSNRSKKSGSIRPYLIPATSVTTSVMLDHDTQSISPIFVDLRTVFRSTLSIQHYAKLFDRSLLFGSEVEFKIESAHNIHGIKVEQYGFTTITESYQKISECVQRLRNVDNCKTRNDLLIICESKNLVYQLKECIRRFSDDAYNNEEALVLAAAETASLEVKVVIAVGYFETPISDVSAVDLERENNTHLMLTRAMCHLIIMKIDDVNADKVYIDSNV